jgi:hypothetical protein
MVAIGCNWKPFFVVKNGLKPLVSKKITLSVASPEKAASPTRAARFSRGGRFQNANIEGRRVR